MTTRRAFLKTSGMSLFSIGLGSTLAPGFLGRTARAAPGPHGSARRKVLVSIFQRGAMDALAAVPPLSDDARLRRLRPNLYLPRRGGDSAVHDLGAGFGLHPALEPLLPLWTDGTLGIVHAVGSPDPTRSHFDAQDYMETATPGRKGTRDGWLNRVSGELGHDASPFRAVAMTPALPRSLYGDESAVAIARLEDFRLVGPGRLPGADETGSGFESLYQETSHGLLQDTGNDTFAAMAQLDGLSARSYRPAGGADYPTSPLGRALRQIAQLIKAQVGLEIAFAESGGWDTHVRQGGESGSFAQRSRDLAGSIAAFWTDLGEHRQDVCLMTMTEFGRTVAENGSGGTDHGHGSCLFVLGEEVAGGRVHGHLPELREDELYQGRDLPVTTDFRSVFAGVATGHLGVSADESLFPEWDGKALSLFRS